MGTLWPSAPRSSAHPDPGCNPEGYAPVHSHPWPHRRHPPGAGAIVAACALGCPTRPGAAPAPLALLDEQWRIAVERPCATLSRAFAAGATAQPVWLLGGRGRCAVVRDEAGS